MRSPAARPCNVDLPKVDFPKVDLPKFDLPPELTINFRKWQIGGGEGSSAGVVLRSPAARPCKVDGFVLVLLLYDSRA